MSKVIIVLVQSNYPAFYPKYTHYMSDGEGRDTYILKHNGGLCNEAERPIAQSRFYPKEKVRVVIPAPRKDAVSFKYISDGSGRDFYITHNSGGLQAPYIPGSVKASATFFTSLRKIEKRNKLIRFASPKEIERMKTSLISQRKLIARLTSSSSDWRKINKELRKSFIKDKCEKFSHKRDNSYDYGSYFDAKKMSLNNTLQSSIINPYDEEERNNSFSTKSQSKINKSSLLPNNIEDLIKKRGFNKSQSIKDNIGNQDLINLDKADQKHKYELTIKRPHSITRVDVSESLLKNQARQTSHNHSGLIRPKISTDFQLNCGFDKEINKNFTSSNKLIKIKDYEHPKTTKNKLLSKNTQAKFNKIRDKYQNLLESRRKALNQTENRGRISDIKNYD